MSEKVKTAPVPSHLKRRERIALVWSALPLAHRGAALPSDIAATTARSAAAAAAAAATHFSEEIDEKRPRQRAGGLGATARRSLRYGDNITFMDGSQSVTVTTQ